MEDNKTDNKSAVSGIIAEESMFSGAEDVDKEVLLEMAKAGVLYGHKKSRKNAKFSGYVFTVRNGIEIIDLTKTFKAIEIISGFIKNSLAEKKTFMVVGTQPAAKDAVLKLAAALGNCPYVVNKWIGGLVTNFSALLKRLEYFKKRKSDIEENRLSKYTKKEQMLIGREVDKMKIMFEGLENLSQLPDIMFVIDSSLKGHKTAAHEAKLKKITLIGIIDNDDDPEEFSYFVPANDHGKDSIDLVVDKIIGNLKK